MEDVNRLRAELDAWDANRKTALKRDHEASASNNFDVFGEH